MTTKFLLVLLIFAAGILTAEALYCYHSDYAGAVDQEYDKCDSKCIKSHFYLAGYPNNIFYQGCGQCVNNTLPLIGCGECNTHLCNVVNEQSLEEHLKAMHLWKAVQDDAVLLHVFEQHLEIVRSMHKLQMRGVLSELVQNSRRSLDKLFGMRIVMDILLENSTALTKLAVNPKKLHSLVWNRVEFERKVQHLDQFVEWLDKN